MDNDTTTEETAEKMPLKHQAGRFVFSSAAAFTANVLAEKAYDAALRFYRAKRA